MDAQDRIAQVKGLAKSDKEAITMLLSSCADMGSANGVLLSVSKFDEAAELILGYFSQSHIIPNIGDGAKEPLDCKGIEIGGNTIAGKIVPRT